MFRNIRLKVIDFLSKNKGKLMIFGIVLILLININTYIGNLSQIRFPQVTKTPNLAVLTERTFPKKIRTEGVSLIEEFIAKANDGKLDEAAEMLSTDAKKYAFVNKAEAIGYLVNLFPTKMAYDIQAYSNVSDEYVYQVKIFKDPLLTGLTNMRYEYWDGKFVIKEVDGKMTLSIRGFIRANEVEGLYEDNNMKIELIREVIFFDKLRETVKITNRTNNNLVLLDETNQKTAQAFIDFDALDTRNETSLRNINIGPLQSKEFTLEFPKLYISNTNSDKPTSINFSSVRFFDSYTYDPSKLGLNAIKQGKLLDNYSVRIPINRNK